MLSRKVAVLACVGACSAVWAQVGTGTWTWEVSADGGKTWAGGLVEVPLEQQEVRVRAVAAWSADAGGWFAAGKPDATWTSIGSAGLGDTVSHIERYRPFGASAQNLTATRFGSVIKVDDARDTLPPGEGSLSVWASQLPPGFGMASTANPAALFEFRIALDGTPGDREASGIFLAVSSGGNTTDRLFAVYTTSSGLTNFPLTTMHNATVRVVPAPASPALLGAAVLLATRRRRR